MPSRVVTSMTITYDSRKSWRTAILVVSNGNAKIERGRRGVDGEFTPDKDAGAPRYVDEAEAHRMAREWVS